MKVQAQVITCDLDLDPVLLHGIMEVVLKSRLSLHGILINFPSSIPLYLK